jgi:hypothetical protein
LAITSGPIPAGSPIVIPSTGRLLSCGFRFNAASHQPLASGWFIRLDEVSRKDRFK